MKLLGILAVYQVVSAKFIFFDKSKINYTPEQDTLDDDMYSNLLNDINLDISFDSPPRSMHGDMMDMNMMHGDMMGGDMMNHMMDGDMNMNMNRMMNMNSMLSFPAFPSASSFFDDARDDIPQRKAPLYLVVESSPKTTASNAPKPRSMFILEETNRVNGNTYRYTVKSDGNNPAVITESWSAPKTMYLCMSKSCKDNRGMQMMDVINDFKDSFGQKYMHLRPSTTAKSEPMMPMMPMMDRGEDTEENMPMMHWMGHMAGNMRKGCRNRMKRITDWYYNDDDDEVPRYDGDNAEVIFLDNDQELMNEMMIQQESDDIMLIGMSAIMVILMVCGLCYVAWRCLVEKKEKGTMDHYVAMGENDTF